MQRLPRECARERATQRRPARTPAPARSKLNVAVAASEIVNEIVVALETLRAAIVAARLPRRKRLGLSRRLLTVSPEPPGGPGLCVVNATGVPLVDPCALAATSVAVYAVVGERPPSVAVTATGVPPPPTCSAHGSDAPFDTAKWQSVICELFGLTVPVRVAPSS